MRQLGVVAIVVVGLMIVGLGFGVMATSSAALVGIQESGGGWIVLGQVFLATAAMIGFGVWLVGSREALASRLFDDSDPGVAIEPFDLLRVGIIVIGLVLLIQSIPRVIGAISGLMTFVEMRTQFDTWDYPIQWWDVAGDALVAVAYVVIGLMCARGSKSVASRLWGKADAAGSVAVTANCLSCGSPYDPSDYQDVDTAVCEECHGRLGSRSA